MFFRPSLLSADVYLGKCQAERHLGYFILYLGFFPKLLQGPIERAEELLPQLKSKYQFNYDNMRFGLLLFAWGLFKKIVVAGRLEGYVNLVYGEVHSYGGFSFIFATYLYAIQLYCDFSGYTDMALGSARLFNIILTDNFNQPYGATSVMDFWRRWHISFSRCLLDYLFKPLQMQFRDWRNAGTALALLITFLISGIWHGANWCFLIWGLIHGIYLSAAVFWKPVQKSLLKHHPFYGSRWAKAWKVIITFNLVAFSWIFFRSGSLSDALYIITHLFRESKGLADILQLFDYTGLFLTSVSIAAVFLVEAISAKSGGEAILGRMPLGLRWSLYFLLVLTIILFNVESEGAFIYVRF